MCCHIHILCRGEEDESLAIKPPQQIARKDKSHHRKEEKRKDKRRHRSQSAEGGAAVPLLFKQKYFLCSYIFLFGFFFTSGFQLQLGNMHGTKTKIKKERASAGSVSGKKTKPDETGRGRNEGNRPGLIRGGKGKALFFQLPQDTRGV